MKRPATLALGLGLGLALSGCSKSDADYAGAVARDLAKGPVAICCAGQSPVDPTCAADAPKRCAYVVGGKVTKSDVTRLPHGGGAQVGTEIGGPAGRGSCHHVVSDGLELGQAVCSPPFAP